MAHLFNHTWTRTDLLNQVGDLSQIAGIKLGEATQNLLAQEPDGIALFNFPCWLADGRHLIYTAREANQPLACVSPTGFSHPMYFDPQGFHWLRTFGAGLLTGCGLTSAGAPGEVAEGGRPRGFQGCSLWIQRR